MPGTKPTEDRELALLAVRIPKSITERLKARADANLRSLTAEVRLVLQKDIAREREELAGAAKPKLSI
jgi:plasmid stability protein